MVKHSNKIIRLAEAGENVLITIPTLDRRSPFYPQNLPGVILEICDDGTHRICTAAGALDSMYMANQFQPSMSQIHYAGGCSRQTGFTSGDNTPLLVWETQAAV